MSIDKSEKLPYTVKQYVTRYHVEIDHPLLCQEWRGIALSNMPDGSLDIDGFFKFRHEDDTIWWTVSGGSCIVKML